MYNLMNIKLAEILNDYEGRILVKHDVSPTLFYVHSVVLSGEVLTLLVKPVEE